MEQPAATLPPERDPWGWTLLLTAGFAVLAAVRLTIPSQLFFDETHYVPAARILIDLRGPTNVEHPMLGKQLIALGMIWLGDNPLGWRIMSAAFGVIAFLAAARAMWWASLSRFAAIAFGVLLATNFMLLIHARIAMLDIFMVAFLALAVWQGAAALRRPAQARWRLALCGIALGCAMGSKWTALALCALPGVAFALTRLEAAGPRVLTAREGWPVPGMSLIEAFVWLGLLPLAIYFATFWPYLVYWHDPLEMTGLVPLQWQMLDLQQQVIEPHPYQSNWGQWVLNWRAIWYLYEIADGAQRGVLLIGNPVSSLVGLAGFAWCAWQGAVRRNMPALGLAALYGVGVGFWIVAAKPIQFFYHYLVPHCLLMGCLALMLDAGWRRRGRWRWAVWPVLGASVAVFAWYWPILSAAALADEQSFLLFAPFPAWR